MRTLAKYSLNKAMQLKKQLKAIHKHLIKFKY